MKTVYHAAHLFDAQMMVHLLGFEGIEARIEGAYLTGALGDIPMGGMVRVCVADDDAGHAEAFVAAHDAARPESEDTGEDADRA